MTLSSTSKVMTATRRAFLGSAAAAALSLSADASIFPFHGHKHRLSNPHASKRAQKLYSYLWSIYGKKTLAGQQISAWQGPRSELDYLQRVTGKQPAILGLDFIEPKRWQFVIDPRHALVHRRRRYPDLLLALGSARHRHWLRKLQERLRPAPPPFAPARRSTTPSTATSPESPTSSPSCAIATSPSSGVRCMSSPAPGSGGASTAQPHSPTSGTTCTTTSPTRAA